MAEHENQRIRLTKRLIKESLFDLLQTNTISDISVTHLAKNAGINRSTFYVHYHDQYEVLEELGYDFVHKIANVTQSEQNLTLADQVAETSRYFKDNIEQTRFLMANFQADSPVIPSFLSPLFSPRWRPCGGGFDPASVMDERQLVQAICAFRLLAPEVELSLSTRESPAFRDRVIPLAINNVSAFSKTQPGGYADDHPELEQFAPHDGRRPEAVAAALTAQGLQPVWKDWDSWLGRASQMR